MKQIRNDKRWLNRTYEQQNIAFRDALHVDGSSASNSESAPSGCGCFGFLLVFLALCIGIGLVFWNLLIVPPKAGEAGREAGNTTILVAGTDHSGINTDTIMLVNFNGSEQRVSIMSIPRDTRVDVTFRPAKINGVYASKGMGEKGMHWLCDYVRQCVGIMPDAFILIDLDCFVDVVDALGGVLFDVPAKMDYDDPSQDLYIHLDPGLQHLDGKEAMGLVRFRKGYALQDLERVNVQREFIKSAIQQWYEEKDYYKMYKAFTILKDNCLTNLSVPNFLWMWKSMSDWGTVNFEAMTIPHTIGKSYIYIKKNEELLQIINEYFNPYTQEVSFADLNIVSAEG